jgi:hypothetical protein
MANPSPHAVLKGAVLPFAPPLKDKSFTDKEEEFEHASCLATPLLLESEEHFRLAHVQQIQRLAQESEAAVQLR